MSGRETATALYLFEDGRARAWAPFSATRPVGELLHGTLLQRERAERVLGLACAGHLLADDGLDGFEEPEAPPVVHLPDLPRDRPLVLLDSRVVPNLVGLPERLARLARAEPDGPLTLETEGRVAGWALPAGAERPGAGALVDPEGHTPGEAVSLPGRWLEWPWSLVEANAQRVLEDVRALHRGGDTFALRDVHLLGDHTLSLGGGAVVEPGVILDLRDGPVRVGAGGTVQGPARITGPAYIGRDSTIFGGSVAHVSIGPVCKVRGEVEASVLVGFDNKAHDGYLGHALLGRWVNLGANTTNSDLKNSYSPVRVPLGRGRAVDTGLLKVGALLGDHVKTGIGTLLNTGTVIGAGSNVYGGRMPPTYVPPFSWGEGEDLVEYRLDKFLEVAQAAMARRQVDLTPGMRELLRRAWEISRDERA